MDLALVEREQQKCSQSNRNLNQGPSCAVHQATVSVSIMYIIKVFSFFFIPVTVDRFETGTHSSFCFVSKTLELVIESTTHQLC